MRRTASSVHASTAPMEANHVAAAHVRAATGSQCAGPHRQAPECLGSRILSAARVGQSQQLGAHAMQPSNRPRGRKPDGVVRIADQPFAKHLSALGLAYIDLGQSYLASGGYKKGMARRQQHKSSTQPQLTRPASAGALLQYREAPAMPAGLSEAGGSNAAPSTVANVPNQIPSFASTGADLVGLHMDSTQRALSSGSALRDGPQSRNGYRSASRPVQAGPVLTRAETAASIREAQNTAAYADARMEAQLMAAAAARAAAHVESKVASRVASMLIARALSRATFSRAQAPLAMREAELLAVHAVSGVKMGNHPPTPPPGSPNGSKLGSEDGTEIAPHTQRTHQSGGRMTRSARREDASAALPSDCALPATAAAAAAETARPLSPSERDGDVTHQQLSKGRQSGRLSSPPPPCSLGLRSTTQPAARPLNLSLLVSTRCGTAPSPLQISNSCARSPPCHLRVRPSSASHTHSREGATAGARAFFVCDTHSSAQPTPLPAERPVPASPVRRPQSAPCTSAHTATDGRQPQCLEPAASATTMSVNDCRIDARASQGGVSHGQGSGYVLTARDGMVYRAAPPASQRTMCAAHQRPSSASAGSPFAKPGGMRIIRHEQPVPSATASPAQLEEAHPPPAGRVWNKAEASTVMGSCARSSETHPNARSQSNRSGPTGCTWLPHDDSAESVAALIFGADAATATLVANPASDTAAQCAGAEISKYEQEASTCQSWTVAQGSLQVATSGHFEHGMSVSGAAIDMAARPASPNGKTASIRARPSSAPPGVSFSPAGWQVVEANGAWDAVRNAVRHLKVNRRGAMLHVSGLPPSYAKEALLALMAARGVFPQLALQLLDPNGRPAGDAYVCVEKVRDARRVVGSYRHPTLAKLLNSRSTQLSVSAASVENLSGARREYLCVVHSGTHDEVQAVNVRGSRHSRSLATTIREGARVTGSMAAAVMGELLGTS